MSELDQGTAYGRAPGIADRYLTQGGPGTPGGEFWRRYCIPVTLSADATTTPVQEQYGVQSRRRRRSRGNSVN